MTDTTDDVPKTLLTFEQAQQLLPAGPDIHTFRQAGPVLLGCDMPRADLLDALRTARSIESTGPMAQSMGHGLALEDADGWMFIATRQPDDPSPLTT